MPGQSSPEAASLCRQHQRSRHRSSEGEGLVAQLRAVVPCAPTPTLPLCRPPATEASTAMNTLMLASTTTRTTRKCGSRASLLQGHLPPSPCGQGHPRRRLPRRQHSEVEEAVAAAAATATAATLAEAAATDARPPRPPRPQRQLQAAAGATGRTATLIWFGGSRLSVAAAAGAVRLRVGAATVAEVIARRQA